MTDSDLFLKLAKIQATKQPEKSSKDASVSASLPQARPLSQSPTPAHAEKKSASKQKALEKNKIGLNERYGRTDDTTVRADFLIGQIPPIPQKRRPERYAYQFWADQTIRLKRLLHLLNTIKDPEEQISLSDMARQAFDDYIDKQIKLIKTFNRTRE
jgi:hypothetical protein